MEYLIAGIFQVCFGERLACAAKFNMLRHYLSITEPR
jgi:hypothetical protein